MHQKLCLCLNNLKPTLRWALWLHLSILGVACVSTEKTPDQGGAPIPTHYVLEPGPVEKAASPLPDLTPIFVRIYAGEQMLEKRLGYRSWDFNKDGNCDMLETLDAQGQVVRRSYDMDRDGRVDLDQGAQVAPSR